MATSGDIRESELASGGVSGDAEECLAELHQQLIGKADRAKDWYARKRRSKKFFAWWLRFLAILFVSGAGLVPILQSAGLFVDQQFIVVGAPVNAGDRLEISRNFNLGQLGYVLAAVAAALVGLDRFLGLSRGWVRYITTEMSINRAVAEFQMDWFVANTCLDEDPDERACPKKRLQLLRDFSVRISTLVEEETLQWAADFESALALLEKSAKETREAERPGSIQVKLERGDDVVGDVALFVDGSLRQSAIGTSTSVTTVAPGQHEVRASAKTATGEEVTASKVVTVPAGGVVPVTLELG